jgi:hypothetical protein
MQLVHTEEVTGSIPVSPTQLSGQLRSCNWPFLILVQQQRGPNSAARLRFVPGGEIQACLDPCPTTRARSASCCRLRSLRAVTHKPGRGRGASEVSVLTSRWTSWCPCVPLVAAHGSCEPRGRAAWLGRILPADASTKLAVANRRIRSWRGGHKPIRPTCRSVLLCPCCRYYAAGIGASGAAPAAALASAGSA